MIVFIESLGWIGLILLALQSGPQIIKLLNKNYKVDPNGQKPFYYLVISCLAGVFYGLMLESKIIYIGVANIIALFLALLTIAMFISRTNQKKLVLFVGIGHILLLITILATIFFYVYNISFSRWYAIVPLLLIAILFNIGAFLPYTIQALKTHDMSQISVFVIYNTFVMNLIWTLNWVLGRSYPEIAVAAAPLYIFVIVVAFQSFGMIFGAYQIWMWHRVNLKQNHSKKPKIQVS